MTVAPPPYRASPQELAFRQSFAKKSHRKAHVAPQNGKRRSSKLLLRLSVQIRGTSDANVVRSAFMVVIAMQSKL